MTTRGIPGGHDPAAAARRETVRRAKLIQFAHVIADLFQILAGEPRILEGSGTQRIRQLERIRKKRRTLRRRLLVAVVPLAAAVCFGYLFGSGIFNPRDRYNADRMAAQHSQVTLYGPAEVYGHPGTATTVEWRDVVRRRRALDEMK